MRFELTVRFDTVRRFSKPLHGASVSVIMAEIGQLSGAYGAQMRTQQRLPVAQQLTHAAILASAIPFEPEPLLCGIYFLIRADQIVYVGQSVNVTARVANHARRRQFDSWAWVACDAGDLDATERAYIDALMPDENLDSMTRRLRGEIAGVERMPRDAALPAWPVTAADLDNVDNSEAEAEYAALCDRMRRLRGMRKCAL